MSQEANIANRVRELIDTAENAFFSARCHNKNIHKCLACRPNHGMLSSEEDRNKSYAAGLRYCQDLERFHDAIDDLIQIVGSESVPTYLPSMIAKIRRDGEHELLETHWEGWDESRERPTCWLREEPEIFQDLARMRYQLPERFEDAIGNDHAMARSSPATETGGDTATLPERQPAVENGASPKQAQPEDATIDTLVTLSQAAALAHMSKRTLESYLREGKLPKPDHAAAVNGSAHRWKWSHLRPQLAKCCNVDLPEKFPGSRII